MILTLHIKGLMSAEMCLCSFCSFFFFSTPGCSLTAKQITTLVQEGIFLLMTLRATFTILFMILLCPSALSWHIIIPITKPQLQVWYCYRIADMFLAYDEWLRQFVGPYICWIDEEWRQDLNIHLCSANLCASVCLISHSWFRVHNTRLCFQKLKT